MLIEEQLRQVRIVHANTLKDLGKVKADIITVLAGVNTTRIAELKTMYSMFIEKERKDWYNTHQPELKVGDTVKIVNYGHWIYMPRSQWEMQQKEFNFTQEKPDNVIKEEEDGWYYDINPDMVGRIGVVSSISSDGKDYSLDIVGKVAWYQRQQLEKIL